MSAAWYSEALLTDRLEITASAMSSYARALKKGERKKVDGKWFIHETAAQALVRGLAAEAIDISSCALGNGQDPPAPEIVELVVTRVFPNPNLLLARFSDDPDPDPRKGVRVKVPKNINFQPGMTIKARAPVHDGPALYILEGRCPRYRGRW